MSVQLVNKKSAWLLIGFLQISHAVSSYRISTDSKAHTSPLMQHKVNDSVGEHQSRERDGCYGGKAAPDTDNTEKTESSEKKTSDVNEKEGSSSVQSTTHQ